MVKADSSPQTPPVSDRRSGTDRRLQDGPPKLGWERRRSVEPRKPEVAELEFTASQWDALHGDGLTP